MRAVPSDVQSDSVTVCVRHRDADCVGGEPGETPACAGPARVGGLGSGRRGGAVCLCAFGRRLAASAGGRRTLAWLLGRGCASWNRFGLRRRSDRPAQSHTPAMRRKVLKKSIHPKCLSHAPPPPARHDAPRAACTPCSRPVRLRGETARPTARRNRFLSPRRLCLVVGMALVT